MGFDPWMVGGSVIALLPFVGLGYGGVESPSQVLVVATVRAAVAERRSGLAGSMLCGLPGPDVRSPAGWFSGLGWSLWMIGRWLSLFTDVRG